ncbi:Putative ras-like guanine nucleotide exchange factor [Septoria linicola]|uniref:Ras-like guanine nucleotide exchange factor n=1 Tax=Septoria linicola TaxID=215465 RepID=A0A9Q9AV89_9PEZI|nr:Putative ras-like guanine nucleotide exchange factor [Septoria linicola]
MVASASRDEFVLHRHTSSLCTHQLLRGKSSLYEDVNRSDESEKRPDDDSQSNLLPLTRQLDILYRKARKSLEDRRTQWLLNIMDRGMERGTLARRRQKDTAQLGRPPMRLRHHNRAQSDATTQPDSPKSPLSGRIRRNDDGFFETTHKRSDTVPTVGKSSVYDEENPKHFTVVNVGAGGVLYLKPSRVAQHNPNYAPATPPATADSADSYYAYTDQGEQPLLRNSYASLHPSVYSGTKTPRMSRSRTAAELHTRSSIPPISLQNTNNRRLTRSASCSTVNDRESKIDAREFQLPTRKNQRPRQRRKSSADTDRGELGVRIPHYRLGTPRFSDGGRPSLHNSVYTNSTIPSSVLSQAEYEKIFPIPPGRGISFVATQSNGQLYLQPSNAYSRSTVARTPYASNRPSTVGIITPSTFDRIESNLDNPAFVHYHPTTGRIVAATPARLIAQITSPDSLDYELLADFFLTFRCFMQSEELLDYLFARLRWALTSGNDGGRIARVRTFVALRHWILNYFADDFMDASFRQNFCDFVNELTVILRQRSDRGGGDMNIVSELKKCWRRTCALYWPASDVLETSPDADIVPGGIRFPEHGGAAASALSLPLSIRPTTYRGSIFEMTTIQLPDEPPPRHMALTNGNDPGSRSTVTTHRTASIPASPLSAQSLEVLSCSVPFLRNVIRASARPREKQEPRLAGIPPKTAKAVRPKQHKRSGSFSDALRDKRNPLASPKSDKIELKDLPSFAVTGGLVRGLLLQPSPSKVDNTVPVTPGPELSDGRFAGNESDTDPQNHNLKVRKFVVEVRRALGSRKISGSRSPARGASSKGSVGSRDGSEKRRPEKRRSPDWQQLQGPSRLDVLGLAVEKSYQGAWDDFARTDVVTPIQEIPSAEIRAEGPARAETPRPATALKKDVATASAAAPPSGGLPSSGKTASFQVRDFERPDTHVTTGSRSIVIVDATGAPELPMMSGALPSLRTMTPDMVPIPLFRNRADFNWMPRASMESAASEPPRTMSGEPEFHWRSSDARMHDLLSSSDRWSAENSTRQGHSLMYTGSAIARKSSMMTTALDLQALPQQLRRVPGGNLRDANHVRSLEIAQPRPRSEGSLVSSTVSRVYTASKLSTEDGGVPLPTLDDLKKNSVVLLATHSSQPILRPSFESEARKLKGIPDMDFEGAGGIEDALLKLEGKIPSPSMSHFAASGSSKDSRDSGDSAISHTSTTQPTSVTERDGSRSPLPLPPTLREMPAGDVKAVYGDIPMKISPSIQSSHPNLGSPTTDVQGASIYHISGSAIGFPFAHEPEHMKEPGREVPTTASSPSASVVPVAARLSHYPITDPYTAASTPESFAYVQSPNSIHSNSAQFRVPSVPTGAIPSFKPGPWGNQTSFLLDDNRSLSEISTEIAEYEDQNGHAVRSFFFDDTSNSGHVSMRPFQPLCATPPSTITEPTFESPDRRQLLPRAVPPRAGQTLKQKISNPKLQEQAANQPFPRRPVEMLKRSATTPSSERDDLDTTAYEKHIPFVLAYESEVIAEQLTIIEKDALDEVDWKDLVSLNWQQSPPQIRNWVDYLNNETSNGIDIVIARFNLVVKWCISEIVLTEAPSERARAITKYIHIASHCHRLRNYASLYQITLALLSNEISRLSTTWSLVALREKHMLEQLEQLCRPLRNFHSLRAEMETAMPGNGIIPFIGLYTHDLMFNALKSARIDPPAPGKEPLVNFERYQTAAAIVKNLLRLIEASSRYTFRPEPEALSRCLWIAALEDSEIQTRSMNLEKE